MTSEGDDPYGPFLPIVGLVADVAGLLSFIGLQEDRRARVAITLVLAVIGVAATGISLWRSVRLWASPRGSYFPSPFHFRRIVGSFAVLVAAAALGTAAVANSEQRPVPGGGPATSSSTTGTRSP